MKRIKLVLSLFVVAVSATLFAQNDQVGSVDAPVITFEETVHDWGAIKEGDVVETDFVFTNTGKTPLVITKIKGSCGCTVPSNWTKEPILPGEKSQFHVKFNSRNKPNKQQKTVTVFSNTLKGVDRVKIMALVTPDPELQKVREERMAKRKMDAQKRHAEQLKAKKSEISKVGSKDVVVKKDIAVKKDRRSKVVNKVTNKNTKRAEKQLKKTSKQLKRSEKAAKKAAKAAKKTRKLQDKVVKAESRIRKSEAKLSKLKRKLSKQTLKGTLSPKDILKKETAIQKLETKIEKSTFKLKKIQRKLKM